MKRRHFIQGVSSSLALACLGCLAACSKSAPAAPASSGGSGSTTPATVTIDLSSQLSQPGDYVVKSGVIVARLTSGSDASAFAAVQANCTHQNFTLIYDSSTQEFHCNNHGSNFNTSGAVVNGPATVALKAYKVAVNGSTLTVTL